jgi:hypothetical protein
MEGVVDCASLTKRALVHVGVMEWVVDCVGITKCTWADGMGCRPWKYY